jgi:cytochrome P450
LSPFIPPFPHRHKKPLSIMALLRTSARNFLAIWDEQSFVLRMMRTQVLMRQTLICNGPTWVRQAFVAQNDAIERKSPQMRHALKPLLGDGLFISDGAIWQKRRKIVAPIIHASRIAEFAPVMVDTTIEMRDRWATIAPDVEVNALSEMAELTAEIICRTIFGRVLGGEHAQEIVEAFSDYQRHIDQTAFSSMLGLPDWLPRWHRPAIRRSVKRITAVMDDIIESYRRRGETSEGAMIGHLLEARDPSTGEPLDTAAIRNEAAVIFMAGHETTANTLAWTWYLLSQAPEVAANLHAELDAVLGGRAPTLADVPRLAYTRAIIEETLRLYPPVPMLAREAVRDTELYGRPVKKNSLVIVVPWLLHRHKQFWDEPDAFMPERFLPGAERPTDKYAYVPFSIGPRVCPGMAFGLTESIICLATLAQDFTLRLRPGAVVDPVARLSLRPEGDGLPMTIHPRSRASGPTPPPATSGGCPFGHG